MGNGHRVDVLIQVSAGGFVKRTSAGNIDFVAPLPCPFNYGEVPGTLGGDGDPLDAVVLGRRAQRGSTVQAQVFGAIAFVDADAPDLKLVCGTKPPTVAERAAVQAWFTGYGIAKRALNRARGKAGKTHSAGWVSVADACAAVLDSQGRAAASAARMRAGKESDE